MRIAVITTLSAALLLSGCVIPTGPVEVTRFNRAAEGMLYGKGSFNSVITSAVNDANPLAATPYLESVAREMQRNGYTEIKSESDVIAEISYSTSNAGVARGRSPVSVGVGGSTGGYRSGVGVGVGLDITNLFNRPKARVITQLSVRLKRRSDNLVIWEGNAAQEASVGSPAAQSGIAASKLAAALFSNFPGKSGETVTVR